MSLLVYLLAVAIDPVPPAADKIGAPHVYLQPPIDRCDTRAVSDEVVVCGTANADARYRLHPIEEGTYRDTPVRAEMKLGNGKLALHNEDKEIGGGQHSKRAMITFTLPF